MPYHKRRGDATAPGSIPITSASPVNSTATRDRHGSGPTSPEPLTRTPTGLSASSTESANSVDPSQEEAPRPPPRRRAAVRVRPSGKSDSRQESVSSATSEPGESGDAGQRGLQKRKEEIKAAKEQGSKGKAEEGASANGPGSPRPSSPAGVRPSSTFSSSSSPPPPPRRVVRDQLTDPPVPDRDREKHHQDATPQRAPSPQPHASPVVKRAPYTGKFREACMDETSDDVPSGKEKGDKLPLEDREPPRVKRGWGNALSRHQPLASPKDTRPTSRGLGKYLATRKPTPESWAKTVFGDSDSDY